VVALIMVVTPTVGWDVVGAYCMPYMGEHGLLHMFGLIGALLGEREPLKFGKCDSLQMGECHSPLRLFMMYSDIFINDFSLQIMCSPYEQPQGIAHTISRSFCLSQFSSYYV